MVWRVDGGEMDYGSSDDGEGDHGVSRGGCQQWTLIVGMTKMTTA